MSEVLKDLSLWKEDNLYQVESIKPEEVQEIIENLEEPNWAPWLAACAEVITHRARVFAAGQLVLKDSDGLEKASLSMNQIFWDGEIKTLPTWDEVAGVPTDYSETYEPTGNTLVLMSMNVHPDSKGQRLPSKLVEACKDLAKNLDVEHLIGSFRPSGFGIAKRGMGYDLDFWEYCLMKRHNSEKPVDPWLGSLWHMGMEVLDEDLKAMTVQVPMLEFWKYQDTYNQEYWEEIGSGVWECGEVGKWTLDAKSGLAVYQESNLWGSLPMD